MKFTIKTTDSKFACDLIDWLNECPCKPNSTVLVVHDDDDDENDVNPTEQPT